MCTLTFVPTEDGYLAGMNRDELLSRPPALPPQALEQDGMEMVYPREPTGGTWIACNSRGNLLALLNWNDANPSIRGEKLRTRGVVIPDLIGVADAAETTSGFSRLELHGIFPFRLIGIFRREQIVVEWRWNGVRRQKLQFSWSRRHWFSSSLSDSTAERARRGVCESAASDPAMGRASWLRGLHRSHIPAPGPFSVCVHRPDAATVSYTEITCTGKRISMEYKSGNPCLRESFDEITSLLLLAEPRNSRPSAAYNS